MPDDRQVCRPVDGKVAVRRRERAIAELATRQHGVVTRTQLASLGFGADAIDYRLRTGRLHPVHRGVFAVGHRVLATRGRWIAAVLAAGPGAVLSHLSAAALVGLGGAGGVVDVTVRGRKGERQGIRFHRNALGPGETRTYDGIPVTTVARTLLDLASVLDRDRLEQAIGIAEARGLGDSPSLPELVERHPRRQGIANLRAILGDPGPGTGITRSELELRFLRFLRRHHLPRPEVNVWLEVGGRRMEVDCLWRDAGLVVELDSREHHLDAVAFETDRARDRALVAAGWRCIRITWRHLRHQPEAVAADLRAALRGPSGELAVI
jgi:very-short-patch-repair endonuclease